MPYGLYSSDGGLRVTVVDEDESPYGIYSTDGSLRVTQDVGRGLYAPNGAIRVAYEDSAGAYTFTGALNGDLDTMNSIFYPNALGTGAWWKASRHVLDGASPMAVLSPASGRSMLNDRAVNDNALISRQGGIKYVVGADGVLSAVPANTLAYDWSSGVRELLLEGQATNLLTSSYGDTATITRCTKTVGQAGPDRGSSAIRVTTTGETDPSVSLAVAQAPSGLTITFSVWLRVNNAGGNALSARLFSYGNTGTEAAQATDLTLTTQWRRYSQTRTFPAGMSSTIFIVRVDPFDGTGGPTTPAAGASIDIDCWQVETGSVATSYIPTSGAAVTRLADVAPLWSGAGSATAWAWRGVIQNSADWQTIIGATGGPYFQSASGSPTSALLGGSADGSGPNTESRHIPGTVGICGGWGPAGRIISMDADVPRTHTGLVDRSRTSMFISNPTGVQIRQVLRLRELVAWQLPDRPSAAGCQSQARLWSA